MKNWIQIPDNQVRMSFVAMIVEGAARKLQMPYSQVIDCMMRTDALAGFLDKHYEPLHTQSADYAIDSVLEYMRVRGESL